jgi:hypothetical protein
MSRRATVLAAVIAVAALAVVVVIAVVFAGTGTDDFHRGTVADLRKALHAKGLTVCTSTGPAPTGEKSGATTVEVLSVALPGECGSAIDLQINAYRNQGDRDAAARNAQLQEKQRNYGVVYTWHRYTLYLQADDASGSTAVRDRVVDALDSVGAH